MTENNQQTDEFGYSKYERTNPSAKSRDVYDNKSLHSLGEDKVGKSRVSLREDIRNNTSESRQKSVIQDNRGGDDERKFTQNEADTNFKKQLSQRADGDTKMKTDSTKAKNDTNKSTNRSKGEKSPRGQENTDDEEKRVFLKMQREANARWQSDWEHKESNGGKTPRGPQNQIGKQKQDTSGRENKNGISHKSEEGRDGLFKMGMKPNRKLGESKDREASNQMVGDFYGGNTQKKSVKELVKRDVSPRRYGDFYPHSTSLDNSSFVTRLEEESRIRNGQQQRSPVNREVGKDLNDTKPDDRNLSNHDTKRQRSILGESQDEKFWLVMDLETNKGFKVKKASSPMMSFNDDAAHDSRRSSRISSSHSMELPDDRPHVQYSPRKTMTIQRPWDKSADPRNRVNRIDDIFRKDKSMQSKTGNVQGKAPWDSLDSERFGDNRKNPDDIFRKDQKNTINMERNKQQTKAPWESSNSGKSPNDFDTMFGRPAYGKNKRNADTNSNPAFQAERAKWDIVPPSNSTKAEQYHKMIHGNGTGLGKGY